MADNRNGCSCGRTGLSTTSSGSVIIDTNRVFDACRDRDCFEDVVVYISGEGQELIDRTSNVKVSHACVLWSNISVEPVQFNRGFYQVTVRLYVKLELEACVCTGRPNKFEGIAVVEKSVILYGGEGNVNIFKSTPGINGFCTAPNLCEAGSNLPTAVVEVVDPVILNIRVSDPSCECRCFRCCSCDEIPDCVVSSFNGGLCGGNGNSRRLLVSLGFFSVIRIERPEQFLISATEYSVPEKECFSTTDDDTNPCEVFRTMDFPIREFQPKSLSFSDLTSRACDNNTNDRSGNGCGCSK